MAKYRHNLPNGKDRLFMLDGGMETTFVFHDGIDLPCFAAYTLLASSAGRSRIRDYYRKYAAMAIKAQTGFILEGVGWRANADWGAQIGHNTEDLAAFNRESIRLMEDIRAQLETDTTPMVISGCVGPRGDGYQPDTAMSAEEARGYHCVQINTYAGTEADIITAMTMTNSEEAAGIVMAASDARIPAVISFTLETDGKLPTGQSLKDAMAFVDSRKGTSPAYFMINCAHPKHFESILEKNADWMQRLKGIRANASTMSHEELDACTKLDDGNLREFGAQHQSLLARFPNFTVLGGCCGTDQRHVGEIVEQCCANTNSKAA
jgi:S-methylmethionine-dependent homocysteine/selenocysteine methylase